MSGQESDGDMSSQRPANDELAFPDLKQGDAWGTSITQQRAAELEAVLQAWDADSQHGGRKGPFDKRINPDNIVGGLHSFDLWGEALTGADVFWLAARSLARRSDVQSILMHSSRPLRGRAWPDVSTLHLEGAKLARAHLEGADLNGVHLEGAYLFDAHLEGANLVLAHLEGAFLAQAHLQGTHLTRAYLEGANLQLAFLDSATDLKNVVLGDEKCGYVSLVDVRWGEVNLAVVDWTRTIKGFLKFPRRVEAIQLGDERAAHTAKDSFDKPKGMAWRLQDYKDAVRANRQLATVLRQQGLNEDADRFSYKAQQLQRQVLRRQQRYGAALGSWLLDVVAGYGYRPMRTLTVYLLAIITFAVAYFALGQTVGPHLSPLGAFVFSMTSFHGRGFFPGGIVLDDPITVLAAFEAFIGLVIEVSFIATFTQRFFAR